MGRKMEWAGKEKHMRGIPRKLVFLAVGAFAKAVATLLNTTSVHNADTLIRLVRSRPPGIPLLTVSNHMSTLDDPLLWGFKGFPSLDANLARWVLSAEDICFKNYALTYFFRLGKCIPITRGAGIYQEHMNEALQCLNNGAWLHTFPEGKVSQEDAPIRRLKWGTASLIVRGHVTPIVLPMVHSGFEEVAISKSRGDHLFSSTTSRGWPVISSHGLDLDEAAQRCLYSTISQQIQTVMEELRSLAKSS
ncbi:hypothetical protein ERO13_D02G101400v2 [Gossypium hirsutum]|uniref:Tafazzin family protein n=1 Tax=Gossypium hirsutum TaxID=3635 RepID=A0A1U8JXW5_GOSHI|nr:N-acylphosphatidylethanolamine synthase isoform X2 [Gossypium hirsutum]KAG4158103.1 hypothetical protein ERO13_D02G101400v2 [Gossypium hirsutum]